MPPQLTKAKATRDRKKERQAFMENDSEKPKGDTKAYTELTFYGLKWIVKRVKCLNLPLSPCACASNLPWLEPVTGLSRYTI
jgi:hypothetical protein